VIRIRAAAYKIFFITGFSLITAKVNK